MTDALLELDAMRLPLHGTRLIQASAGTGKTHTICSLLLRLILEEKLPLKEILIVTYTNAATQELRDRIRARLREAYRAFFLGREEDPFLKVLIQNFGRLPDAPIRLMESLRGFDEAPVFTIHGFCQRILSEHAYETGGLFDTRLLVQEDPLTREYVQDFWRRHLYRAEPELVSYVMKRGLNPESLLRRLQSSLAHIDLKIRPEIDPPALSRLKPYRSAYDELKRRWTRTREEVRDKLMDPALKGGIYGSRRAESLGESRRERKVSDLMEEMDFFLDSDHFPFPPPKGLERITIRSLRAATRKGYRPPEHEVFDACETLMEEAGLLAGEMDQWILHFQSGLFRQSHQELAIKKAAWNVRSFSDLLKALWTALKDRKTEALSQAVSEKYRAALIDEFQDTDLVQYEIFQSLFGKRGSFLLLIGDPKQAIYGFRGADLFAYMRAARQSKRRYTLKKNWRSHPGLLQAVNTLFGLKETPFLFPEIPFIPMQPGDPSSPPPLVVEEGLDPSLEVWLVNITDKAQPGRAMAKSSAKKMIARALAVRISAMVQKGREGKARIGEENLSEKHMAVLVRKNMDARLVYRALQEFNIPSVLYSADNVFDSHEAMEMEVVLTALANPDQEGLVKAALSTDMLGMTGKGLRRLTLDEKALEATMIQFGDYRRLWEEKGFLPMFSLLMKKEGVRARLLVFPDGERRLTNLFHLSELIHQKGLENRWGPGALLKWLSGQRDPASPRLEEHQLRLESDELAVKIVTIHRSKGLEYPVVFCPFSWEGSRAEKELLIYHDPEDQNRLTLDLGSGQASKYQMLADGERLAEDLRILYVALTRAKTKCTLVWGRINGAETSPLAYLLHGPRISSMERVLEVTKEQFLGLSDREILHQMEAISEASDGCIRICALPQEHSRPSGAVEFRHRPLTVRTFSGFIQRTWGISSFSSLSRKSLFPEELPDYDAQSLLATEPFGGPEKREEGASLDMASFPKGARAGTLFHDLLEHLDFTKAEAETVRGQVVQKLDQYGFEPVWEDPVCDMVRNLLSTPLDPAQPKLRLEEIQMTERLNELEFFFPLNRISPRALQRVFSFTAGFFPAGALPKTLDKLQFAPTEGFMRGFIDLVFRWKGRFYLVDWKSNFLGSQREDYAQEALGWVMQRDLYFLQYHLYAVALDQYLRMRLPGYDYQKDFGGVFYIFLRGVRPEWGPDFGIYRDRPAPALMTRLREVLVKRTD